MLDGRSLLATIAVGTVHPCVFGSFLCNDAAELLALLEWIAHGETCRWLSRKQPDPKGLCRRHNRRNRAGAACTLKSVSVTSSSASVFICRRAIQRRRTQCVPAAGRLPAVPWPAPRMRARCATRPLRRQGVTWRCAGARCRRWCAAHSCSHCMAGYKKSCCSTDGVIIHSVADSPIEARCSLR